MYTAILFNATEQARLLDMVHEHIPEGWRVFLHHVTLNMGPITKGPNTESLLNTEINFTVDAFGMDDKVCAVRVSDMGVAKSSNKVPHVTAAVDQVKGGKPFMSNDIKMWVPLGPEVFSGKVMEIGQ